MIRTDDWRSRCERLVDDHGQAFGVVVMAGYQRDDGRPHQLDHALVRLASLELDDIGKPFAGGPTYVGLHVTVADQAQLNVSSLAAQQGHRVDRVVHALARGEASDEG